MCAETSDFFLLLTMSRVWYGVPTELSYTVVEHNVVGFQRFQPCSHENAVFIFVNRRDCMFMFVNRTECPFMFVNRRRKKCTFRLPAEQYSFMFVNREECTFMPVNRMECPFMFVNKKERVSSCCQQNRDGSVIHVCQHKGVCVHTCQQSGVVYIHVCQQKRVCAHVVRSTECPFMFISGKSGHVNKSVHSCLLT